ncbi:molybdate ABC transporter substrate-binding protein [Nesterenkonia sp. CF4.4]|uniref:molybdate ABC transporter substrate-binding protein n=1 Tax=Nesterenkonia sp. CF4.4 TaxID=3373079 RepID=UPI003EE5DB62
MKRLLASASALSLMLLSACASPEEPTDTIQVFAAASLTESFTEIGEQFQRDTDVEVSFNFAGSADLAAQLGQGAPADVFASADEVTMNGVEALTRRTPAIFASNTLTIVTPEDNPAAVEDLTDLAGDDVITVICAPQVPCGAAAAQVTKAADVELSPASEESAVTDVLGKVRAGEADAGLVFVTDASAAGADVQRIDFAESQDVVNRYPIATLESSENPGAAEEFLAFVEGDQGQAILHEAGFGRP